MDALKKAGAGIPSLDALKKGGGLLESPYQLWWECLVRTDTFFPAFPKQRQLRSQLLILHRCYSENWHITSSSFWRWYISEWQTIHSTLSHTLAHHTHSFWLTFFNSQFLLIQSLALRFWYAYSRTCSLFHSVQSRDNSSSLNIYLYLLVSKDSNWIIVHTALSRATLVRHSWIGITILISNVPKEDYQLPLIFTFNSAF